ncbi:uncharacterized protein F5147DRAFT_773176 [Suillus discolor]|uniref:DUF4939 domain-containing protein n=1 Tax=Suillus discolor TaxID=1912936 RepID=A0A9P7F7X8_9AGAM|nr:uncharacterized protein F5147DRAFT_773176 [Suillus discolor]KAG2109365.1 hypothetical protein F5147DRAFT_773176 [Suillus discolor]
MKVAAHVQRNHWTEPLPQIPSFHSWIEQTSDTPEPLSCILKRARAIISPGKNHLPLVSDEDKEISDAQPKYPEEPPLDNKPSDKEEEDSDDDMPKPIEKKIGVPPDFNGDRELSSRFIRLVRLYLDINAQIYKEDTEKIGFTLSFFKEGTAAIWMEDFIDHAMEIDLKTS